MRVLGWRWVLALLATASLTLLAPGLTPAHASQAVLPLPALASSTTITSYKGHKVLEVLDMHVTKIARGAKLLITCGCQRRLVAIHETRTPTSRTFRDVDWLLTPGHAIHVAVTKPPALGRYMVLVSNTQHHQLVFQTEGCLTVSKTPQPCPSGVATIPTGTTVTSTSGGGTTGTGTSGTGPGSITNSATQVAVGGDSACALLTGGSVDCWGENYAGQLGDGSDTGPEECNLPNASAGTTEPCSTTSVRVSGITNATAISAGNDFACALLSTGSIDCWGNGALGVLGNGTTANSPAPVPVSGISNATAISTNGDEACALLLGGSIDCWGENVYGELGDGTNTGPDACDGLPCSTTPVPVSGLTNAIEVAVSSDSTCALLSRSVECWGNNEWDELGDGTDTSSTTPVAVSGATSADTLAGGLQSTCAFLGGSLECWGYNVDGELGNGTTTNSAVPVPVSGLTGAFAISGGGPWCAISSPGSTIDCWGENNDGTLGDGSETGPDSCDEDEPCSTTPVPVSGITNATAVSTSGDEACALLSDGGIDCWGYNAFGQLGDGTDTGPDLFEGIYPSSPTPVTVSGFG
jgi:alpha-tubulin suppressor-like RCC1 family protein